MIKGPPNNKPARPLGTELCCLNCEFALLCLTHNMFTSYCIHCGKFFQLWVFEKKGKENWRFHFLLPEHCTAGTLVKYTTGICLKCFNEELNEGKV